MMRTRAQLETELMDAARSIAPIDPMLQRRTLKDAEVLLLSQAAASMHAREQAMAQPATAPAAAEPHWLAVARLLIGTREIKGPQHLGFIAKGWARLGAPWYNDDETPWCGFFVAHCIDAAGLPVPGGGRFASARAWLDWGKSSAAVVGAVAVFGRDGGGHVGFAVGESAGHFYVLGGNQSNMVSIAPIAKSRLLGLRWPASVPASPHRLPRMSGGVMSRNEA
jgi:uncharacterized protein (TIGR02594 family)